MAPSQNVVVYRDTIAHFTDGCVFTTIAVKIVCPFAVYPMATKMLVESTHFPFDFPVPQTMTHHRHVTFSHHTRNIAFISLGRVSGWGSWCAFKRATLSLPPVYYRNTPHQIGGISGCRAIPLSLQDDIFIPQL